MNSRFFLHRFPVRKKPSVIHWCYVRSSILLCKFSDWNLNPKNFHFYFMRDIGGIGWLLGWPKTLRFIFQFSCHFTPCGTLKISVDCLIDQNSSIDFLIFIPYYFTCDIGGVGWLFDWPKLFDWFFNFHSLLLYMWHWRSRLIVWLTKTLRLIFRISIPFYFTCDIEGIGWLFDWLKLFDLFSNFHTISQQKIHFDAVPRDIPGRLIQVRRLGQTPAHSWQEEKVQRRRQHFTR